MHESVFERRTAFRSGRLLRSSGHLLLLGKSPGTRRVRCGTEELQMHPVIIIVGALLLRVISVLIAAGNILGLGLAGDGDLSWHFLPAFILLYFAFAPKPAATGWIYVAVSAVLFIAGSSAVMVEHHRYPDQGPALTWLEFGL